MNKVLMIFLIAALLFVVQSVWAGQTVSQTFTIGVYIPPHAVSSPVSMQQATENSDKVTTAETVVIDRQEVVLLTTVAR